MGDTVQQSLDLASYIANLPKNIKASVFGSSWTAQALFRALSPLSKQYILRLVYVDGGVPNDSMQLWLRPEAQLQHRNTMHQLEQLSVLQIDRQGLVQLNEDFRRCLKLALSGRGQTVSDAGLQQYQGPPPIRQLMEQAARHWQAVLLYILDSDSHLDLPIGSEAAGFSIQELLLTAGLVVVQGRSHELTPTGLRYLLQPRHQQVWRLLREYIRVAEQTSGSELASTLSFLMQLSFRRVWQPLPLAALTPQEQAIAAHMAQLGLVATCKQDGATFFCATPLAASLCGGTAAAAAEGTGLNGQVVTHGKGGAGRTLESSSYIIVETNFRVYAHTSSTLQRRVLSRLMRTDCLLPNLYVGTLTRETFTAALGMGLCAQDIHSFLQEHAHPQVARRVPCVPENVKDQLELWEQETKRLASEPATCYSNFEDEELLVRSMATAQNHGSFLCADQSAADVKQRFLIIKRSGHEALRNFIVELKRQRSQHQHLM